MTYFENLDEPAVQEQKRPVFLTVICILTFVGCGIYLISSLVGLFGNQEAQLRASFELQKGNPATAPMAKAMLMKIPEFMKWSQISNYASLINVALCLTGSLMMWKLKKMGFIIYIAGEVVIIAASIGLYMVVKDVPFMGMTMLITNVFTTLVLIAFIIMYGVNLKHMR